ncbi:hypothetical protein A2U01_0025695, partial [Trifolium medium]|nr:hypothetical protein [Trifolium medium]
VLAKREKASQGSSKMVSKRETTRGSEKARHGSLSQRRRSLAHVSANPPVKQGLLAKRDTPR